jgi:hypothetical protein
VHKSSVGVAPFRCGNAFHCNLGPFLSRLKSKFYMLSEVVVPKSNSSMLLKHLPPKVAPKPPKTYCKDQKRAEATHHAVLVFHGCVELTGSWRPFDFDLPPRVAMPISSTQRHRCFSHPATSFVN